MKHIITLTTLIIYFIVTSQLSISQSTGQIIGKVTDEGNGDGLIGVSVLVEGTSKGSATDIDGKYIIKGLSEGTYSLKFSGVGYSPKKITGIKVKVSKPTEYNVMLAQDTYNIKEVVIAADEIHSAESAILTQRKKATAISDGISSEQIKRTPDATSGDALKRITGLAITDNKFVYIRGVTDRYNGTTMDGASVTSTELGKKSFSFDLVPSNLIENISVIKSATPDLPGDFSGGLVQLHTLDFPSKRSIRLNIGESMNSITTSKDMVLVGAGSKDWLGYNDGTFDYPGDQADVNDIGRKAKNTWGAHLSSAPINNSFSLSYGDHIEFDSDDANSGQVGLIAALSYKNTFQHNDDIINDSSISRNGIGSKYSNSILWGGIFNVGFKFAGNHKISFKNNFNQSGENNLAQLDAVEYADPDFTPTYKFTTLDWTQRSAYTGQLVGDHTFPSLNGSAFTWRASVSSSRRDQPDRKIASYFRLDSGDPYRIGQTERSWSFLNTRSITFGGDFTIPISTSKFKFGVLNEFKKENYQIRYFNILPDFSNGFPDSLRTLPLNVIFSQNNYGRGKYIMDEITFPTDSYRGEQGTFAAYGMLDVPFELLANKFHFVGGVRLENSNQNLDIPRTFDSNGPSDAYSKHNADILPSLNLTYMANEKTNIRFAYSQSVNRPEFWELAPTEHYNYVKKIDEGGNINLTRALVKNYDIRAEYYPYIGELIAVSYFSKDITDAIEEKYTYTSNLVKSWENVSNANNYGWELEARKTLDFLGGYASNFSITGNYTRVFSKVEVTAVDPNSNSSNTRYYTYTRPMQGQSPYIINLSLLFQEPTLGTSISLLYNKFGTRLAVVGYQGSPADTYENAREVVDLAISQRIQNAIEAKFTIKNLTNNDMIYTRDASVYEQLSIGQTYALSLSLSY